MPPTATRCAAVLLALLPRTAAAQVESAPPAFTPHAALRLHGGWVSPSRTPGVAWGASLGYQASPHLSFLLRALWQRARRLPPGSSLGLLSRQMVMLAVEWSLRPMVPADLTGDLQGALRLSLGGLFRQNLDPAGMGGLGAFFRLGLARRVAVVVDVDGYVSGVLNDPVTRCGPTIADLVCINPFASDAAWQVDAALTVGLEVRMGGT